MHNPMSSVTLSLLPFSYLLGVAPFYRSKEPRSQRIQKRENLPHGSCLLSRIWVIISRIVLCRR